MREIVGPERDLLILQVLNRIDALPDRIASPERRAVWERGWQESLDKFRANPCEDSLIPAFVRPGLPLRWMQSYWMPDDPDHELNYIRDFIGGVIATTFRECEAVYEFGAGTGYNLVRLAQILPHTVFCGFDFVPSAVELIRLAGSKLNLPIGADLFNMALPSSMHIPANTGVLTFGAIEQLGGSEAFKPFIEYLIMRRPKIVLHVEPTIELYDPTNLIDALAIRFHKARNYTTGLLPYLQAHPKVEMLKVERGYFGSLLIECSNQIVWRVK